MIYNKRGPLLLYTLCSIFLLVTSDPKPASAESSVLSTPENITTEYFSTTEAGFLLLPDLKTQQASYSYSINYKTVKRFTKNVWAEIEFQNPELDKEPVKATQTITPYDQDLIVMSPPITGLKESMIYTVVLRVYEDHSKQHLITEHAQKVQAPSAQQLQTIKPLADAFSKGYAWHECSGMKAKLLLPPGWHFKEVAGGDTVACFVSKEEIIGEKGQFSTGLSINRFGLKSGLQKYANTLELNRALKEFVRQKTENLRNKYTFIRDETKESMPYLTRELELVAPELTPPAHMVMDWTINTRSGGIYYAVAEAPESRWAEDWPLLEPIINYMSLDPSQ